MHRGGVEGLTLALDLPDVGLVENLVEALEAKRVALFERRHRIHGRFERLVQAEEPAPPPQVERLSQLHLAGARRIEAAAQTVAEIEENVEDFPAGALVRLALHL